ncbi:2Fe-2S iron-sulfur cluster-binding protein [Hydrogenophaga sp. UC242_53]|uniref:2Fe-2S iron-sulfur cluster-binding protein n=1 Tax=Hydrogenophaga sp. UC242_53 TaxID=3350170 RepID=UPI0036D3B66B
MPSENQPSLPPAAPSRIHFVVNGQPHRLDNPDPNRTLLNHLREALALTGTKEGCAEGDCGACTVVVSEPHGQGVRRRAVNACIQLLPTLHGKEVLTVEGLAQNRVPISTRCSRPWSMSTLRSAVSARRVS